MPIVDDIRKGSKHAISKAITLAEDFAPEGRRIAEEILPYVGNALRIGVTGPPGAGKSTLVDVLSSIIRREGKGVGIIAVDPTSPFTGGALLGDRIRMVHAAEDDGIFVRSMATRDGQGGVARATLDVADLLDASGKECVLIETVGVGQSEIEISRCADCVVLVLSPESGDGVQAMKSGLMEATDIVAINKADRGGADKLELEIKSAYGLSLRRKSEVPVVLTEAINGKGIDALLTAIRSFVEMQKATGAFQERRLAIMKHRIQVVTEFLVRRDLWNDPARMNRLESLAKEVLSGGRSAYSAAELLIKGAATV